MRVLHLTLKAKFFDMIASGEKLEEYRALTDYWGARLCYRIPVPKVGGYFTKWMKLREGDRECLNDTSFPNFAEYDVIRFARGGHFHSSVPQMTVQFKEIKIGTGKPEWGAEPGKEYFVIKLGEIITPGG